MKVNNKKNEIIETAYDLIIKNGYENISVDEIISKIGIAKGTFYYYFETKEELLEDVIDMMLEQEKQKAESVLNSDLPVEAKLVGIISAMSPNDNEKVISSEIQKTENSIIHQKTYDKLLKIITPMLTNVVEEGVNKHVFNCDNIEIRVKLLLIISHELIDDHDISKEHIDVFIDTVEKILGTKKGAMQFIAQLIGGEK